MVFKSYKYKLCFMFFNYKKVNVLLKTDIYMLNLQFKLYPNLFIKKYLKIY